MFGSEVALEGSKKVNIGGAVSTSGNNYEAYKNILTYITCDLVQEEGTVAVIVLVKIVLVYL